MSDQIYIRPYDKARDARLLVEWLYAAREKNLFDPDIFTRGHAVIFTAFDATGVVGFIPVVTAYLCESLAWRPGLAPVTQAKALRAFQHVLVNKAAEQNVPDAFSVVTDEELSKFMKSYGWTVMTTPLLNLHFARLEKQPEENDDAACT